ncbi:MAG TPA: DHHA1 domain-containing protein, partial [Anaerolineae bacterium]
VKRQSAELHSASQVLGTTPENVSTQSAKILTTLSETLKALEKAQKELAHAQFYEIVTSTMQIMGVHVLAAHMKVDNIDTLREMTDWFRERHPSGVVVLGAVVAEKPVLVAAVSRDLNARGLDAGKLVREIAKDIEGSGGGKPTLAQAGGKDATGLDKALARSRALIKDLLSA